jgi:hypothetical protein
MGGSRGCQGASYASKASGLTRLEDGCAGEWVPSPLLISNCRVAVRSRFVARRRASGRSSRTAAGRPSARWECEGRPGMADYDAADGDEICRWEFDKDKQSLTVAVNRPLIVDDVELVISGARASSASSDRFVRSKIGLNERATISGLTQSQRCSRCEGRQMQESKGIRTPPSTHSGRAIMLFQTARKLLISNTERCLSGCRSTLGKRSGPPTSRHSEAR